MSDAMTAPSDVSAVEYRIAQLSQDAAAPLPAGDQSVAAFRALLNSPDQATSAPAGQAPIAPAQLESLIARAAMANGEDPALVKAIVANESGFDPSATSQVGAQGLMQLMPSTAAGLGVRDAYDPAQNVAGGTRYLAQLLQRFGGNVPQAVAAYNAGPEAIAHDELPAETRAYVRNVLSSYDQYRAETPRR
jgi:soluble lytic murein transglycosylase-like protein